MLDGKRLMARPEESEKLPPKKEKNGIFIEKGNFFTVKGPRKEGEGGG